MEIKVFYSIWNHLNLLGQLVPLHLYTHVIWVYCLLKYFNSFSAGIDFIRHNLTSLDVRFWRIKKVPALKRSATVLFGADQRRTQTQPFCTPPPPRLRSIWRCSRVSRGFDARPDLIHVNSKAITPDLSQTSVLPCDTELSQRRYVINWSMRSQ